MEEERKAQEAEELQRQERMQKIKDQFADPNSQWEKDKNDIQNEAMREKNEKERMEAAIVAGKVADGAGPVEIKAGSAQSPDVVAVRFSGLK
jgi:mannan polymerase II complex ANP1 subunit